jgi:hypothetical protein
MKVEVGQKTCQNCQQLRNPVVEKMANEPGRATPAIDRNRLPPVR